MKSFKEVLLEISEVPLIGLPKKLIDVGNNEMYTSGPNQKIRNSAKAYMKSAKLKYNPPKDYKPVDVERATRITNEYDEMKHDPNNPNVKESYKALAKETIDQFHHITKNDGLKLSWMKKGLDPYEKSLHLAGKDVKENNHLWVYPTDNGFGSSNDYHSDHPMLQKTGVHVDVKEMLVNDAFRAVYDYYGHFKKGLGFRANGEENAWRQHASMFSKKALPTMTTETRGQNSWVNFGPYGKKNKVAKSNDTIFADQKAGLMHPFTHTEGL